MCAKCALAGADVGTMPTDIFKKLISHPLTDKGLAAFIADAKKANVTIKELMAGRWGADELHKNWLASLAHERRATPHTLRAYGDDVARFLAFSAAIWAAR